MMFHIKSDTQIEKVDDFVKSLKFKKFKDRATVGHHEDLPQKNLELFLNWLVKTHKLTPEELGELDAIKLQRAYTTVSVNLFFDSGKDGYFRFGRVVSILKSNHHYDIAYFFSHIAYHLAPKKITYTKKKKMGFGSFSITYGSKTFVESRPWSLTDKQLAHLRGVFMKRAHQTFNELAPPSLTNADWPKQKLPTFSSTDMELEKKNTSHQDL
jgi:hypothetical protein